MWRRLFFFIFSSLLASQATPEDIIKIERDLALGFPQKALERIVELREQGALSSEEREQLALLKVEAEIVLRKAGVEKTLLSIGDSKDPMTRKKSLYWKGIWEIQKGEYGAALEDLEPLLADKHHPYYDSILVNVCHLYLKLDGLESAEKLMGELKSEQLESHAFLKVEILIAQGQWDEAKRFLEAIPAEISAISRDLFLSWIYYQEAEMKRAIKILEEADAPVEAIKGREALSFLSSLYYEDEDPRSLELIMEVLMHATEEDNLEAHFDQLLLSSQNAEERERTLTFLTTLQGKKISALNPYLLYTKAQLTEELRARLEILSKLYSQYPTHPLAVKASYSAALLSLDLDDVAATQKQLRDIIKNAPDSSVKATVYASLAEVASGKEKAELYKAGLKHADLSQASTLRLNHNIAQFQVNGTTDQDLILTSNDQATVLLERALSSQYTDPQRAQKWLEEFLQLQEEHPRKGEAHLCLAEILLNSDKKKVKKSARGHLDTIQTVYLENLKQKNRYYEARLKLAIIEKNLTEITAYLKSPHLSNAEILHSGVLLYTEGYALEASELLKSLDERSVTQREKALADLYIGLSYFQLGTAAHEQDALARLEALAGEKNNPLSLRAQELLANHYYVSVKPEKALEYMARLPETPDNMLLKAKTLSLFKGEKELKQASQIYRSLYENTSLPVSFRYRVAYQLALFQEENGYQEENLELYYQVVNFEVLPQPEQEESWELYRRMGDKGITLLEDAGNWMTAFKFAQLLAKSTSPDKEYFQKKSREISLQHIFWEEDKFE